MNARLRVVSTVLCTVMAMPIDAHDVITTKLTWSRDISRVFARRCLSCHGAGSSIPLTTYEQVRPWAVDIKEQVLSRAMPPWGAVKGFGDLSPDGALSQEEMLMIAGWVIGGAPEGDTALRPKAVTAEPPKALKADALNSEAAKSNAVMKPVLEIDVEMKLAHAVTVGGLRPLAAVESARITATTPAGDMIPLVWLYHYDPASNVTFRFSKPIVLPAGTRIAASAPVRFELMGK